jgi:hypothetical protein
MDSKALAISETSVMSQMLYESGDIIRRYVVTICLDGSAPSALSSTTRASHVALSRGMVWVSADSAPEKVSPDPRPQTFKRAIDHNVPWSLDHAEKHDL